MRSEWPGSTRGLPAPAVVLIVHALLVATRTMVLVCMGALHDPQLRLCHSLLDRVGTGADVLLAGLMATAAIGLLCRRRWGRRLLAVAWPVYYAAWAAAALLFMVARSPSTPASQLWLHAGHTVAANGFWAALAASYLCTRAVRTATGEMAARPPDADGPAGDGGRAAGAWRLLIAFVFVAGLGEAAIGTEAIASALSQGSPPGGLLTPSRAVYWLVMVPLSRLLAGGVGIAAGAGLLARRRWARWALLAFGALVILLAVERDAYWVIDAIQWQVVDRTARALGLALSQLVTDVSPYAFVLSLAFDPLSNRQRKQQAACQRVNVLSTCLSPSLAGPTTRGAEC